MQKSEILNEYTFNISEHCLQLWDLGRSLEPQIIQICDRWFVAAAFIRSGYERSTKGVLKAYIVRMESVSETRRV